MDIIQESARNFKSLTETTTYTFHISLNKKITVFDIDFEEKDKKSNGIYLLNSSWWGGFSI